MANAPQTVPAVDPLLASYAQLAASLLKDVSGICLLDFELKPRGQSSALNPGAIKRWLQSLRWEGTDNRAPSGIAQGSDQWLTAIPLEQSDATLLGVFCVRQLLLQPPTQPSRHAIAVAQQLKPLLDCVHRDFAAALPTRSRVQALTERTAELEWLFQVTANLKGSSDDRRLVEELLI